jgi:hypothetical protein
MVPSPLELAVHPSFHPVFDLTIGLLLIIVKKNGD